MKTTTVIFCGFAAVLTSGLHAQPTTWTVSTAPTQAYISNGPWTLADGPVVNPTAAGNYCVGGAENSNVGSTMMQPYYFPFVTGRGMNLQGYFDWRPRNLNEAVVAANSTDGGLTWNFQQKAEQMTPACPGPSTSNANADNLNNANGNDAGLGHPHILNMGGANFLYLLDRRNGHVDSDGLVVHRITPSVATPLSTLPLTINNSPAGATTIVAWDFNALPVATNNTPAPSVGTGTASALGMTNSYTYSTTPAVTGAVNSDDVLVLGGSSDPFSPTGKNNAWRIRGKSPGNGWNLAAPQYTQGAEFDMSTVGYTNIVFQFDWFCTTEGVRNMQVQYSTDTTAGTPVWTNVGPVQIAAPNGYNNQITINFAALGITAVENIPHLGIRLVSVYDTTLGTYAAATLSATNTPVVYNNSSGNWRFDSVKLLSLPATNTQVSPDYAVHTTGLQNPDGILAVIPGTVPRKVLYIKKTLNGAASLPSNQQCLASPRNGSINNDLDEIRLAQTSDGINFTDLGPTNLTNPTTTSFTAIRYAAPNGSIVRLANGNFGLFFGAGNCLDGDSDGLHAIVYAEASPSDFTTWTFINNIDNPIANIAPLTTGGITYPQTTPLFGAAQAWWAGRVYNPMAMYLDSTHVNLIFSGYDSGYPGNSTTPDINNYRTIGHAVLTIGNNTIQ